MVNKLSDYLELFNTQGEGLPSQYKIFGPNDKSPIESFGAEVNDYEHRVAITYQNHKIGEFWVNGLSAKNAGLWGEHLSPLLRAGEFAQNLKVLAWVKRAREIAPEICQWTGIYYKASYLDGEDTTDLVLGPYIGAATDHVRIPINRGFCGMALREERSVNVEDVHADSTHIACSLTTKSELVIPLKNKNGEMIAELDIDSDRLAAFSKDLQARFEEFANSFSEI